MKHDIRHNALHHKNKEEEVVCCDKAIDSLFWFFGYMDGVFASFFIDCFSKENYAKKHAEYAAEGFLYGYEEGDEMYEHGIFYH